ncbi:hypothetical protein ACEF06_17060 [Brevibacillus agri]
MGGAFSRGKALYRAAVAEEKEETTQDSWDPCSDDSLPGSIPKGKPRPKWSSQDACSEWTLKSVFPFFHCASDGVPKILRLFLLFPLRGGWLQSGFLKDGKSARFSSAAMVGEKRSCWLGQGF